MNGDRFDELVGQLLDGELAPNDVQELTAELKSNSVRRQELCQHLVTWDLWSQQQAPERSAEAFTRALRTRRRAEQESESFVAKVRRRLKDGEAPNDSAAHPNDRDVWRFVEWLQRAIRSHRRLWLTTASLATLVIVTLLWTVPHRANATVTLRGEAICTACTLHETHAHFPAIRVHDGDRTTIYYVNSGRLAIMRLGDYCLAPFPVVVTGAAELNDGKRTLDVAGAARPSALPNPRRDDRVLFPF